MRWFGAGLVLAMILSACAGVTAKPSPYLTAGAAASPSTAQSSIRSIAPGRDPALSASPTAKPSASPTVIPSSTPSPAPRTLDPPRGDGLSVQWRAAELDLTGVDRASVSGIVSVPTGGYLAWGHGYSNASGGGSAARLFWRSDDGHVWERSVVSGPTDQRQLIPVRWGS